MFELLNFSISLSPSLTFIPSGGRMLCLQPYYNEPQVTWCMLMWWRAVDDADTCVQDIALVQHHECEFNKRISWLRKYARLAISKLLDTTTSNNNSNNKTILPSRLPVEVLEDVHLWVVLGQLERQRHVVTLQYGAVNGTHRLLAAMTHRLTRPATCRLEISCYGTLYIVG